MLNILYDSVNLKKIYNATMLGSEEAEKIEKEYQEKYKNHLNIEDGGFTVYSKTESGRELSKGCQACKHGKWLCVFVGYNCNLRCPFCPQPKDDNFLHVLDEKDVTSHGTMSEFKYYLSTDKTIEGVSYSGGEPLLYIDKIFELGAFVKENCENVYQWIYTNGVLLDEQKIKQLKEVGINEIRIDLAATNFAPEIIAKIPLVKKYIEKATVEIPAIPEIRILMENNLLDELVAKGLDQLNLAELTIAQEINMERYGRNSKVVSRRGFCKGLSLFESQSIYYEILDYVINHKLDLLINNCNAGAKFLQMMNKQRYQQLYKT